MSENIQKLLGEKLIDAKGIEVNVEELKDKIVALYFSAHWCPPCRQFMPTLTYTYNTLIEAGKPFEIVFVSSDQNQTSFDQYLASMPWKAIPYSDEATRAKLTEHFGIRGIPALIVLNASGELVSANGRADVTQNKSAAWIVWNKQN